MSGWSSHAGGQDQPQNLSQNQSSSHQSSNGEDSPATADLQNLASTAHDSTPEDTVPKTTQSAPPTVRSKSRAASSRRSRASVLEQSVKVEVARARLQFTEREAQLQRNRAQAALDQSTIESQLNVLDQEHELAVATAELETFRMLLDAGSSVASSSSSRSSPVDTRDRTQAYVESTVVNMSKLCVDTNEICSPTISPVTANNHHPSASHARGPPQFGLENGPSNPPGVNFKADVNTNTSAPPVSLTGHEMRVHSNCYNENVKFAPTRMDTSAHMDASARMDAPAHMDASAYIDTHFTEPKTCAPDPACSFDRPNVYTLSHMMNDNLSPDCTSPSC